MGRRFGRAARGLAGRARAVGPLAAGAAAVLAAAAPRGAAAQAVLGGFEDATVPARGEARIRIHAAFSDFWERYGGTSAAPTDRLRPLGARFSFDTLGAAQLPLLAPLQSLLAGITDGAPGTVSLGRTVATARGTTIVVPVVGELGLTRRISVGVTLPIVRTRQVIDVQVNPGGTTGNVGFNPAVPGLFTGFASDAQGRDLAVQTQFANAIGALRSLLAQCPTQGGVTVPAGCAPVTANRAAATALVANAGAFATGVASVYGSGSASGPTGLRFVPVAGSPLQRQVEQRLAALAAQFRSFGVDAIAATTAPAGSPARIATAGLQRILVDPDFGIGVDSLRSIERSSPGDVDVAGTLLLVDTFGAGAARLAPAGVRVRASASAGFRIGVPAGVDAPFILFDLPTATGANAVLLRAAADVAWGPRWWGTLVARWASPLADEQLMRITDVPEQPFPERAREQLVGRQLGRELELQVTPRYTVGDKIGLAVQYALRDHGADRYTGTFHVDSVAGSPGGLDLDAATLGIGTAAREQRVGFGVTYSTVAAALRRRTSMPIEISYLHSRTVAGSGGIPKLSTDAVQVRLFVRLAGRR